jgi:hypothetical protein
MDQLATRIWRNSDSALVLTGHEIPSADPPDLGDVPWAAASEIEEYGKVPRTSSKGMPSCRLMINPTRRTRRARNHLSRNHSSSVSRLKF